MLGFALKCMLDQEDHNILVAAHRGAYAVSTMENTVLAFNLAIQRGADMVEVDLSKTKDNVLIGFHDDNLSRLYHRSDAVQDCTYRELCSYDMYNYLQEPIVPALNTWNEILTALKGRTTVILDKAWDIWDEASRCIEENNMTGEVILKYYIEDSKAHDWAKAHKNMYFIPMMTGDHASECMLQRVMELKECNAIAALELLPKDAKDPIFSREFICRIKEMGIKVWCNSLSLCKNYCFGGGYDDTLSLLNGGQFGWGELIDRGIDIIQTDWPLELRQYLTANCLADDPLAGGEKYYAD